MWSGWRACGGASVAMCAMVFATCSVEWGCCAVSRTDNGISVGERMGLDVEGLAVVAVCVLRYVRLHASIWQTQVDTGGRELSAMLEVRLSGALSWHGLYGQAQGSGELDMTWTGPRSLLC